MDSGYRSYVVFGLSVVESAFDFVDDFHCAPGFHVEFWCRRVDDFCDENVERCAWLFLHEFFYPCIDFEEHFLLCMPHGT